MNNPVKRLLRSLLKSILHLLTGKCELERLTIHFPEARLKMVKDVRSSLRNSKTLVQVKRSVVENYEDFSPKVISGLIREIKKFENSGLRFSIGTLRKSNLAIAHLKHLSETPFSSEYDKYLEELWKNLKPNQMREGTLRHSQSWSEVGFQGFDPATDFRGGGLLSLQNLRFFAETSPNEAVRILNHHCKDITRGGFPFAITGINITSFLLTLAIQRKLDDLFLFVTETDEGHRSRNPRRLRNFAPSDESTPLLSSENSEEEDLNDEQVKTIALERFNQVYCVIFVHFARRWHEAAPRDVMGFPFVFNTFKKEIEQILSTPDGILALASIQ